MLRMDKIVKSTSEKQHRCKVRETRLKLFGYVQRKDILDEYYDKRTR